MGRAIIGHALGLVLGILGTVIYTGLTEEPTATAPHVAASLGQGEDTTIAEAEGNAMPDEGTAAEMPIVEQPSTAPQSEPAPVPPMAPTAVVEPWLEDITDGLPVYEPRSGNGWIAGRVTEAGTVPIAGAVVSAQAHRPVGTYPPHEDARGRVRLSIERERWNAVYTYSAVTDADGRYRIENIPEDWRYDLEAQADGYNFTRLRTAARHYDVAPNARYDFVGTPTVRVHLTVLLANGEVAPEVNLCTRSAHGGSSNGRFTGIIDTELVYQPGMEVYVELHTSRVESSAIVVPATDVRPIPDVEGVLRFTGPGGLQVELQWGPADAYFGMILSIALLPLEDGQPATGETLVALMADGRASRQVRELDPMGRGTLPSEVGFPEVTEGRFLLAVFARWPVIYPLATDSVTITPGTTTQTRVSLFVSTPPADDFLEVRFVPASQELLTPAIRIWPHLEGPRDLPRFHIMDLSLRRNERGQWLLFTGTSRLTDTITAIRLQIMLRDLGFGDFTGSIPVEALRQGLEVPLQQILPFTIRLHRVPAGLTAESFRMQIDNPNGPAPQPQWAANSWQVDTLPAGTYTLNLGINSIPVVVREFTVERAGQVVDVDLPALYTLTVEVANSDARQVTLTPIVREVPSWPGTEVTIREGQAVFDYLPAGRYQIRTMTTSGWRSMEVDVLGDATVTFSPAE